MSETNADTADARKGGVVLNCQVYTKYLLVYTQVYHSVPKKLQRVSKVKKGPENRGHFDPGQFDLRHFDSGHFERIPFQTFTV